MRDAGRQLADLGEAFLQSKLLFHLDDRREIGEEADHAVGLAMPVGQRRDADAEVGGRVLGRVRSELSPDDRLPRVEALVDHQRQSARAGPRGT